MEVIGHQHKLMQQVLRLATIVAQDFDEESSQPFRVEQVPTLPGLGGYKVGPEVVYSSRLQGIPQGLKPLFLGMHFTTRLKSCPSETSNSGDYPSEGHGFSRAIQAALRRTALAAEGRPLR